MKVTFTQKDWDKLRTFQNSFNEKLGLQAYVGTDSACLLVEYSLQLKSMLRPFPSEQHFTFELRALKCEDCPQHQPFLCAGEETTYLCDPCWKKREEKKKKERERQQKQKLESVS